MWPASPPLNEIEKDYLKKSFSTAKDMAYSLRIKSRLKNSRGLNSSEIESLNEKYNAIQSKVKKKERCIKEMVKSNPSLNNFPDVLKDRP